MNIINEITERLSIFKNMYDIIRVVDPVNKKIKIVEAGALEKQDINCYDFWNRGSFCKNCISMRAYECNDTFTKIEYSTAGRVFLVTATPVNFKNKTYVAEIIKEISQNCNVLEGSIEAGDYLENLITTINDKAVEHEKKHINTKHQMNKDFAVYTAAERQKPEHNLKDIEISELNENINEIRDILNEISCTSDNNGSSKERLLLSEYLDKLIVKYMKKIQKP